MIKNISDGYVTFEWDDGETHCLKIDEYNHFISKQGFERLPLSKDQGNGLTLREIINS
jgi:hypothetical protein